MPWAELRAVGQDSGPARGAQVAQLPARLPEELLEPQSLCTPEPAVTANPCSLGFRPTQFT